MTKIQNSKQLVLILFDGFVKGLNFDFCSL